MIGNLSMIELNLERKIDRIIKRGYKIKIMRRRSMIIFIRSVITLMTKVLSDFCHEAKFLWPFSFQELWHASKPTLLSCYHD
jgi:hypothetical protein